MVLKLLAVFASGALITAGAAAEVPTSAAMQNSGIRGRLDIRKMAKPVERRPDVAAPGAAGPRDVPDLRRGVVYLETAPRSAFDERDPGHAVMDQRNERFVPHLLAVIVGTIVDFPNSDLTYHNVFSISKTNKFDLGRYARGKSKSVRFAQPGVVRIFCDIHSHMSAFVLVFSHPYYAKAEVDGRYRIDNVPPGTYTVSAWHEGETAETKTVTVPPQGGDVDLDFVVP